MKEKKSRNSSMMLLIIAVLILSTVNVFAFDTQKQELKKMRTHMAINSIPTVQTNYMRNVQISSNPLDDEHPTITLAHDDSIIIAYDRQITSLKGHIYFMRSTDGTTWSEIWNTDIDDGGMADGLQNWPVLVTPPDGNKVIGSWNDEIQLFQFFVEVTDPANPNSYAEGLATFDQSDFDYDRHTYTLEAYDENRFAVGHIGHVIFAGLDLPSNAMISYFTEGFEGGMQSTGDEDYPIGYNCSIAVTDNYFWYTWESPDEATDNSFLVIKWGDGVDQTDAHLWPEKRVTSNADCIDPALDADGTNLCLLYMTNDNIYGDFDLACMYSTDEGATWEDGTFPSQPQVDEKGPEIFLSGSTVFCTFVRSGNLYLTKSTDLGKTWGEPERVNEVDGTVVDEAGAVEVSQAGIVWVDTRNGNRDIFYAPLPAPIINVESISGGMGITATITNTGTVDAINIPWSIDVSGLVFLGAHTEGAIDLLAGGETTISSSFIFGVGPGTITVTVGGAYRVANCFILGPLVLGVN